MKSNWGRCYITQDAEAGGSQFGTNLGYIASILGQQTKNSQQLGQQSETLLQNKLTNSRHPKTKRK